MVYGLLLDNELYHIRQSVSSTKYSEIVESLQFKTDKIVVSDLYPENIWVKVGKKASSSMGISEAEFYLGVGTTFVKFVEGYGFTKLTGSIGRHYRDFVQNLDNVHHYLGDMFIHMKAPSFFVESETSQGMTLIYRSKRRGYSHYVIGQMKEISRVFYNIHLKMEVLKQEVQFDNVFVKYKLEFDNAPYDVHAKNTLIRNEASMPFKAYSLFETFPFSILFDENLIIKLVGQSLRLIIPHVLGQSMNDCFLLVRPLIQFSFDNVVTRTNNVFVFEALSKPDRTGRLANLKLFEDHKEDESENRLQIKGQLVYIHEWRRMLFLGCPFVKNICCLTENGLFISDMSTHDLSVDLMMMASLKSMEARMAQSIAQKTSALLERTEVRAENMRLENESRKKMGIARCLKNKPEDWIENRSSVSVLVAKIHDMEELFNFKKNAINAKALIGLMDSVITVFDHLVRKNSLVQLDALDNCYVAVGGFLDPVDEDHADRLATLALDLNDAASTAIKDPYAKRKSIKMQIGLHVGPAVATFVGRHLPKFCIFGSVLEKAGYLCDLCPEGKILISSDFKTLLPHTFRYGNAPASIQSSLNAISGLDDRKSGAASAKAFCLLMKEDHAKVSMIPILKAYARFKAATIHEAIAMDSKGFTRRKSTVLMDEETMGMMTNGHFCAHFQSSQVCHIL